MRIKIGDIKPNGWLRDELMENMEGCIGHLDDLAPRNTKEHDIYGKHRIRLGEKLRSPLPQNGDVDETPEGKCREIIWEQEWKDDILEISFETTLQFRTDMKREVYVTYGPLVYALPLPAKEEVTKEWPVEGFCDKNYVPLNRDLEKLEVSREDWKTFCYTAKEATMWWNASCVTGVFTDDQGHKQELEMVPMARTILRKVTFEMY